MKMRKIVAIVAAVLMLLSVMPIAAFAADTYELATSIEVGDTVVLVCKDKSMELNGISTTSTKYGLGVAYTTAPAGAYALTVEEGYTAGTYSFKCPNGQYLYWTSGNSLNTNATKNANTSWTVTFSGDNAIIKNAKDTARQLQWNASSPRFACYGNSGQTAVQLFKLSGGEEPPVTCDHDSLTCGQTCPECSEYTKEHVFANNCAATCSNCDEANPNYADHVYSGDYDTSCNVCGTAREVTLPTDPTEIVNLAYSMVQGDAFPSAVTLTGIISSVNDAYSEQYSNITVTIDVIDADGNLIEGKAIQCYRMKGEGADSIIVGDTITVSGILKNYGGTIEFDTGCTLDSYVQTGCAHEYVGVETTPASCTAGGVMTYTCSICGNSYTEDIPVADHTYVDGFCSVCGAEEINLVEYTITFDADKTQRTEFNANKQVWTEGALVFTNNKGGSSSNVGDYSNPVRLYKTSEVVIACPGMTSIVIDASSVDGTKYATPWADTLTAAGLTYTATTNNIYTVTLAEPVDSITLTCSAQIRALSITVTAAAQGSAAECEHTNAVACDKYCPDCSSLINEEAAHKSDAAYPCYDGTCEYCGETVAGDGHSFDENDICTVCGQAPVPENPVDPENPQQYVFSEFAAGTQYAENEKHYLDNAVTVITSQAHFTSELRLYSSTTYNGSAIIKSTKDISAIVLNAGNKVDVLNLYVSEDGEVYEAIEVTATTYNDYTVLIPEMTKYIKLDVAGDQQIRIKNMTLYFDGEVPHVCEYTAEVTKEATCGEAGVTTYTCSCGASYTEEIPATGEHVNTDILYTYHDTNDDWHKYHIYCVDCGVMLTDWIEEECTGGQATCTDCATCEKCGLNYGDTVDHTYDDEYDADCNVCGEVREVPEKPVEVMYGDANGDGEVNLRDVAVLQQYTSNWEVTLNLAAADANGDGEVNLRDVALLQQYTSNWEVTLGPVETPEEPSDDNNGFNDGELEW